MMRVRPGRRLLTVALVLSAALHAVVLGELPGWSLDAPDESGPPLQARLQPPPETLPPAITPPPPAKPAPPRRAAAPPRSVPVPSPDAASAVEGPPTASVPDPDPTPAAVAEAPSAPDAVASAAPESPLPAAPAPPAVDYPVRNVRLVYDLLHGESRTRVGSVVYTFRTDGERYEAEAVAEAVGLVSLVFRGRFVQRSRGVIGPAGFVPSEYTLERGRGDPPERAVFDWDDGKLDLAWREERRSVELPAGAQDPLSVLHQIYFMPPLPLTRPLAVATSRKLGRYVFELLGDADLQTPMGSVPTLHIGRVEQDGSVLEVWLDRSRDLLPVRIYSRDRKGTILDQVVREVTALEERPVARLQ
jgi:hypothetical protein